MQTTKTEFENQPTCCGIDIYVLEFQIDLIWFGQRRRLGANIQPADRRPQTADRQVTMQKQIIIIIKLTYTKPFVAHFFGPHELC